ncbi:uncharacterized protein LOC117114730 isoform X2 [Anneissia japonica]|uniref:uncharacterized protein LOC117114730 isoform X2 n=1 Tax=Anneissia japonica TaxID=1529436 RepID=UPI001425A13A|nr:uncharacterized protein LOC117114730 isoform X2 [Anneissia japonica]
MSLSMLETKCCHTFCAHCLFQLFRTLKSDVIPCVKYSCPVNRNNVRPPSELSEQSPLSVQLRCQKCSSTLLYNDCEGHKCSSKYEQTVEKIKKAVNEINCQINKVMPNELEKIAHKVLHKSLKKQKEINIITNGRPLKVAVISNATKSSDDVSKKTVSRRTAEIKEIRRIVSCGNERKMQYRQQDPTQDFIQSQMISLVFKCETANGQNGYEERMAPVTKIRDIQQFVYMNLEKHYKGYKIKLFLFGDYDFMIRIYGLQSPNGRYGCLLCTTTKDEMNKGIRKQQRSMKSLSEDLKNFIAAGSCKKTSKDFSRNVVRKSMVNIDIDHVSIPCLHISLGVFKKLYDLLELEAHDIDSIIYKLRQTNPSESMNNFELANAQNATTVETCKEKIQILREEINTIEDNMTIAQLAKSATLISSKCQTIKELEQAMESNKKL